MNAKYKFSLLLSLIVTVIIATCITIIYLIYASNREDAFRQQLKIDANNIFQLYAHNKISILYGTAFQSAADLERQNNKSEQIIVNNLLQVVYYSQRAKQTPIDSKILSKIRVEKEYFFEQDGSEVLGKYYSNPACYILVKSYDKYGLTKLAKLRWISILVLLGGLILTAITAVFFINQVTKPLNLFNDRMEGISEKNLNQRMPLNSTQIELNRTAKAFNDMLDRLQQAFEFQKSFVHHASHELRTPLASMLAQTEAAIKKDLTPEEGKMVLQSLREDQQEMIDLTNSLLLLSQYEKLMYSTDWPLIRLDEVLYEIITVLKRAFSNINISVEFLYMPENELFLSIHGNDALLRSAFRNLIKNAYQYSEDRKVTILIEAEIDKINIHFDNTGRLISHEEQQRLFIPFFRGQNAQRKKGFGLGLSIVRRIILLHKGDVTYKAINEDTNRFTIFFNKKGYQTV